MTTVEDSVLNGLVLFAIIIFVVVLLARKLFNSKRWKDANDGKLKKAPVVVEVIFAPIFIYVLITSMDGVKWALPLPSSSRSLSASCW